MTEGEKKKIDLVIWIAVGILVLLAIVPLVHAMNSRRGDSFAAPPRHVAPAASSSAAPVDR